MNDKITLTPVAMVTPNKESIYAPASFKQAIEITSEQFANYGSRQIKVSFDEDGVSNPITMTAYSAGLGGWYI